MASIGVYSYVLWGKEFDLPFVEMIESVKSLADEIVIITDPRMEDGTLEILRDIEDLHDISENKPNLKVIPVKLDLNDPGLDGVTKALARKYCQSDVLIQMDADEILYPQSIPILKKIANNWPSGVQMIGTGVINWFNGEHFKLEAAGWSKERMSLNVPEITHGIPAIYRDRRGGASEVSDGAGYITPSGDSILGDHWLCNEDRIPKDIQNKNSVWIGHYSWYSLTRKWDMKHLWHWMWGNLHNQFDGITIDEYDTNLDGETVDFWNPRHKRPYMQIEAIKDEMKNKSIVSSKDVEHPPIMTDWISRQPVYYPKSLLKKAVSRNI